MVIEPFFPASAFTLCIPESSLYYEGLLRRHKGMSTPHPASLSLTRIPPMLGMRVAHSM